MSTVEEAVAVLESGGLAVLPTDTVYGLVCRADLEASARDLYRLKGRAEIQPTAVIFPGLPELLAAFPGLDGRTDAVVRELLPGPFTLVLAEPSRRYAWLSRDRPGTLGARVPLLPAATAAIAREVGPLVATSANLTGEPDAYALADVSEQIRKGVRAEVDGGQLPGIPSTVVDLTGPGPVVLRVGAVAEDETLARVAEAEYRLRGVQ